MLEEFYIELVGQELYDIMLADYPYLVFLISVLFLGLIILGLYGVIRELVKAVK